MTVASSAPVATYSALTLLGLAILPLMTSDIAPNAGNPPASSPATPTLFTITGTIAQPLSPGRSSPLDLELTNNHFFNLQFTGLHVTLESVDAPMATAALPCSVDDFEVKQLSVTPAITVPERSTTTLSELGVAVEILPHLGMLNPEVNQDGCKGAILNLRYDYTGSSQ
jgi:hypothetical protein